MCYNIAHHFLHITQFIITGIHVYTFQFTHNMLNKAYLILSSHSSIILAWNLTSVLRIKQYSWSVTNTSEPCLAYSLPDKLCTK